MTLVERVQARLAEIQARRTEIADELEAIANDPEARGLTSDEAIDGRLTELRSEAAQLSADQASNEERLAALQADDAARAEVRTAAQAFPQQAHVRNEARTYNPDAERRGVSFLADLANRSLDPSAQERLLRHQQEARVDFRGQEFRDIGTGAFAGLTVPQYLTDMVAPYRQAGRPTADICNKHPLPPSGMTVNISRVTTSTAAAVQASENATVQETDMDDTLLTVNVRTIAGQQDVSRQALDRAVGADQIVLQDLVTSYNTKLNNSIINDDGTSGTHLGIRSTSSIIAVTYTDASPTAAEAWPKLWDLVQQIQAGVFMGVSHFIMHPRRWWWFVSQVGTSFPFLQVSQTPWTGGSAGTTEYGNGPSGNLGGIPVIVDGAIPTTVSSTQDVILGVTASELHLWEEPGAPLLIRAEQTNAANLSVKFVVYGYSAFTAGRYPGAHGTVSGSGTTTPTF